MASPLVRHVNRLNLNFGVTAVLSSAACCPTPHSIKRTTSSHHLRHGESRAGMRLMDELLPSGVSCEGSWKGSCLKTGLMHCGKMLFPDGEMCDERRGDNDGRDVLVVGGWCCHKNCHGTLHGVKFTRGTTPQLAADQTRATVAREDR